MVDESILPLDDTPVIFQPKIAVDFCSDDIWILIQPWTIGGQPVIYHDRFRGCASVLST
jgi:hypothetical protein